MGHDGLPWYVAAFVALFTTLSCGGVVLGIRVVRATRAFLRDAVHVPGVVTALRQQPASAMNTPPTLRPVLRFTTLDGRLVEAESDVSSAPAPARVGEQRTVLYDPADPTRARLAGVAGNGALFGVLFVVASAVFTLVGLAVLVAILA